MLHLMKDAKEGDVVWDKGERASIKGLHVRVRPGGSKCFYLYYRTRSQRQRRPKIGDFGEITLAEARRRARLLLDRVATGDDPKGDWDKEARELTVQELFTKTVEGHWALPAYRTSKWAIKEVPNLFKNHLKGEFGALRLSEVTPLRVRKWHSAYLNQHPYVGNRALTVLSKMFNFAEEQEWRLQHTNPCNLVKNHPEKKRKRFATEEEIRQIAALMDGEVKRHPHGVAFLYLLMFSGSRPSAIERAGWNQLREFNVDGQIYGILTFKGKTTGKTGNDENVILPPQAMRVLARLPRIEGETITGIKMPRRLWKKIKTKVGCTDLWARDWRRTFATVGNSGGVSMGVIGELLNHQSTQTTKIYAKVTDKAQVEAATLIANQLERIMAPERGSGLSPGADAPIP